jgi:hypothetical protein
MIFFVVLFMCIFFSVLLFLCTRPFCRFRVCYLDFALSLDSVVFLIIRLPCSFGILLPIFVFGSFVITLILNTYVTIMKDHIT